MPNERVAPVGGPTDLADHLNLGFAEVSAKVQRTARGGDNGDARETEDNEFFDGQHRMLQGGSVRPHVISFDSKASRRSFYRCPGVWRSL